MNNGERVVSIYGDEGTIADCGESWATVMFDNGEMKEVPTWSITESEEW